MYEAWQTMRSSTCSQEGLRQRACKHCQQVEQEALAKSSHFFAAWQEALRADCAQNGTRAKTCQGCGFQQVETLAPKNHVYDRWRVDAEATCDRAGQRSRACKLCGQAEQEALPLRKHSAGRWQVSVPASLFTPGEQAKSCKHCAAILETRPYYPGDKAFAVNFCLPGLRFRDAFDEITNEWYRFYLVDLTRDSDITLPLIAADAHVVGQVTLKVVEGRVAARYALSDSKTKVLKERFHLISSLKEMTEEFVHNDRKGLKLSSEDDIFHNAGQGAVALLYLRLSGVYDPSRPGNPLARWQDGAMLNLLKEQSALLQAFNQ